MHPVLKLALTLLLVALNGFFVVAEFAIIRVRQTRIAELADEGSATARSVQSFLSRLDTYLSATQLGVTLASLALGAIGEPAMSELLRLFFHWLHVPLHGKVIPTLSIVMGFLLITFLHIIFGELLPKWWVIVHTERAALRVARPMGWMLFWGYPLILLLESVATLIARVLKIEPGEAKGQAHSESEILAIMTHAHEHGELRPSEIEIAENVFHFAHTQVREIMVPRVDMVYLDTTWSMGRNVEVAVDNGYTRYPLCENDSDHVIGMVHVKDVLAIAGNPNADIRSIRREILVVPETKPIDELLKEIQKSHSHLAVVLDEYGGTAGIATLEDIIEELIGEIQDEHDEPPPVQKLDPSGNHYSIAGTVALDEAAETLGIEIENPDEYETIGGYALHQLKLAPRYGALARLNDYDVSVSEVAGRRIKRLTFQKDLTAEGISSGADEQ